MIGALTAGKKAVMFGYKRYGIPGAIASGGAALAGYIAVRRALDAATDADEDSLSAAIDAQSLESTIDQEGLGAVADVGTLDEAIDRDQLRSSVDVEQLGSSVSEDVEDYTNSDGDADAGIDVDDGPSN